MFQYVRPTKVLAALEWLKVNNPLYQNVQINVNWEQHVCQDDTDLWEALTSEYSPRPSQEHSQQQPEHQQWNRTVSLL